MPQHHFRKQLRLFSSDRERRLWLCALAVVAAIFSTLGLASLMAEVLYSQTLSAVVFLVCMALVGLTILTQGLRARPGGVEIGIGLGIAVVYLMLFLRLTIPERSHLIEYSVLAVFIYEALAERARRGRRVGAPALLAILATTLIGTIDEVIQLFLPSRHFDWTDIIFNFLAGLMAVVSLVLLSWGRRVAAAHTRRKPSAPN